MANSHNISEFFSKEYFKYFTPEPGALDGSLDVPFEKLGDRQAAGFETFTTYGVSESHFYDFDKGDACQTGMRS